MDLRRTALLGAPHPVIVRWNQIMPAVTADGYEPYSNKTSVTFADEVATMTWIQPGTGYNYSLNSKPKTQVYGGHVYYFSYMLNPDFDGVFSVDYAGDIPDGKAYPKNVWGRYAAIHAKSGGDETKWTIFPNLRSSDEVVTGSTCKMKAPYMIDLTMMYGSGNEPDIETFERELRLNGINVNEFSAQNISGENRTWWRWR